MILFRLLSFAFRLVGSFLFVFLLQIQFNGKSLEDRLNDFGQKFIVTRILQDVSKGGARFLSGTASSESSKEDLITQNDFFMADELKDFKGCRFHSSANQGTA